MRRFVLVLVALVWCGVSQAAGPVGYTYCAAEGGGCFLPSPGLVVFGTDAGVDGLAHFTAPLHVDAEVDCTAYLLTDPAPGYAKACYYLVDSGGGGASSPSGGGTIDVTEVQASNAVMWGLLVVCFGVGVLGGRAR